MNLKISEKLLDRISRIDWFNNCGNPIRNISDFKIKYVNSIKVVKTFYSDQNWEDTTLEARNYLTSFLSRNYIEEYQKWNEYTSPGREYISKEITPKLEEYKKINKLNDNFIHCVQWDILNAIMEDVYKEAKDRPTFFLKLLEIYESGNFPCGWIGTWPEGTLVVY